MSARTVDGGDRAKQASDALAAAGRKAASLAEMGLGATMMAVAAGETALGVTTAGAEIGFYEDGFGRRSQGGEAAMTPHADPWPPSPPLVPAE